MGRLDGKVVLVTGAARGTGAVTAQHCAAEGAQVLVTDVLDEAGAAIAEAIGDRARYRHLDVTSPEEWAGAVADAAEAFGGLDVVVNNAAVLDVGAIADTSLEVLTTVISVNQIGAYLGIQAAIEPMKERGGGSIINVASIDAIEGSNGVAAYTSSKWGMRGLTKAAAIELGCEGIRVNTVCPGTGSAEMVQPFVEAAIERLKDRTERLPDRAQRPFNRAGDLDDVAKAIVWLASDDSSYVSAIDLTVDGGWTAGKVEPGAPFS